LVNDIVYKINEYFKKKENIDQEEKSLVYLDRVNGNCLDIVVIAYTFKIKQEEFFVFKTSVLMELNDIVRGCSAEVVSAYTEIHLQNKS